MLPLRVHNIIDYLVGAFLIVAPWVLNFADIPAARTLFLLSGIALIGYSLLTNYYFSIVRWIPLGLHMTLDTVLGLLLILAPALFSYRDLLTAAQATAHIVIGASLVALVALTRPRTENAKTAGERAAIGNDLPTRL